ncbi:MAG: chemotaxis protein CheW [Rhodospirillales bacterium]
MDDLLNEFLTESAESLAVIDGELVKFEQNPQDTAILQNIFRLVHTIKGTCGFLGLPRLESVAHAGENVLGKFREGTLEVTPGAVTLILGCIDTIRTLLGELEETGSEPEGSDQELIDRLNALASGEVAAAADPPAADEAAVSEAGESGAQEHAASEEAPASTPPVAEGGFPVAQELLDEVAEAADQGGNAATDDEIMAGGEADGTDEHGPAGADTAVPDAGGPAAKEHAATGKAPADMPPVAEGGFPIAQELLDEVAEATAEGKQGATDDEIMAGITAEGTDGKDSAGGTAPASGAAPESAPETPPAAAAPQKPSTAATEKSPPRESSVAAQSIRVNVEVLEDLMTLVSEMVLTRNQLMQMVRGQDDSEFTAPLQRLSLITTDLQEGVMKTRMQPIGNAWAKLPRIVRDLSVEGGKKIEVQMVGAETELDRQVLELIKDPLTHMIRNSADHGLETPEERRQAGKPETGTIRLNAYHEGGHIIIEITDDGRGLDTARIKDKILQNGLASEAELEGMSDVGIQQFVFKAGFSTAQKVTSISGRGVGMDVVRTNVEKIGGTIELMSVAGRGTTFTIKIPLTLAIVSALVVECGGQRFAIPQISVLELVRASAHSEHAIEMINDAPVLRLRDRLLPLVSLFGLFGMGERKVRPDDEVFIVVAQVGAYTFGLMVDKVFDTEEIVVKPVAPILRDIQFYSGNTILGDGSVIMILDPNGIAAATGQGAINAADAAETAEATDAVSAQGQEKSTVLIFRAGGEELKAVPLALVARLEEIDMATTEQSNDQFMVQYRGHLMPLIPFNPAHEWKTGGRQPILVFTEGERSMGLVVDDIVDIVEDDLNIELSAKEPGLVGSAVIDGKATSVIDAGYYLIRAFPDWFGTTGKGAFESESGTTRVLLVDDSPFFRNLLSPLLSVAGYDVTAVGSARDALTMREAGTKFDIIISDIEMPEMNGFEFAREVRGDARWEDVPMVALSAHATEKDFERGRAVGFNDYVAKFDREVLVRTLTQTVAMATQKAA